MNDPTPDDPVEPEPDPTPPVEPPPEIGLALSSRHRATLAAIFVQPTRANLRYRDVETLLLAVGASGPRGEARGSDSHAMARSSTSMRPTPNST